MSKKKIAVIGGGPAGIMAAGIAAKRGNDVVLIEKNDKLGKKLFISGKGRCNITNACDIKELISNIPTNGKFLYNVFHQFGSKELIDFFNHLGLETKIERGGRVFPLSDKSSDVLKVLNQFLNHNRVKILQEKVKHVRSMNGIISHILLENGKKIDADSIVIATGGLSYPLTGSTGDGYKFAQENGHKIIPLKPSLVPLETKEKWVKKLDGLTLKNISVSFINSQGKKVYTDFGEMTFMPYGVSGPIILSASSSIRNIDSEKYVLEIDLKPALPEDKLDERLVRDFQKLANNDYSQLLKELLPMKLIPVFIEKTGIPSNKKINQISKDERKQLLTLLKRLTLNIINYRPVEEAIVTSGGVCVDEINPKTMESKIIKGLYFAGEIIDADAYTGGFNLQIAFSTGYAAGMNC